MSNKTNIEEDIKIINIMIDNSNNIMSDLRECEVRALKNILADRERLEKEENKYKIALFMIIRNSIVMPKRNRTQ